MALLLGSLSSAVVASAQIEQSYTHIGRADADGSRVDESFITALGSTGTLAVAGTHVYWSSYGLIGRASLDGSDVQPFFIRVPMISDTGGMVQGPSIVSIDGGAIYWAVIDMVPGAGANELWRAQLDGSHVEHVLDRPDAYQFAVGAGHVYWINGGTIGRANLDGTGVVAGFMNTGAKTPGAVGVFGTHIYWSDMSLAYPSCTTGTIGRANIDGSGIQPGFIGGLCVPQALAFGGGRLYWTDQCNASKGNAVCLSDTIGRANLDGSGVQRSLIGLPRATLSKALAVDGAHMYFITWPKPWVDALRISPRTFKLSGRLIRGGCRQETRANRTRRRCTRPIHLQVSYRLNFPASVTLRVARRVPGRQVNGRCVATAPGSPPGPTCTRIVDIGGAQQLKRIGRAGQNTFSFDGTIAVYQYVAGRVRIVRRRLTDGSYLLIVHPFGLGNTRQVPFRLAH